jgi:rare lipoprotein A
MSGAHKTLPLPSYVRVTNLANGRSVVVRVNDRGPFHSGRIIDLSYAAALKLGYLRQGSARVRIETVFPGDVPEPQSTPATLEAAAEPGANAPPTPPSVARQDASASAQPAPAASAGLDPGAILDGAEVPMPTGETVVATLPPGAYVQLGAFRTRDGAEGLLNTVGRELGWIKDRLAVLAEADRYRLHAGPFPTADAAREVARRIADSLNLTPFVVTR